MGTYSGVLRLHVYPVIGHVPLKAMRPSHVTLVLVDMDEKGLSRAYQHQAHKAISGVFKMAIDDDWWSATRPRPSRPLAVVTGPRSCRPGPRCWQ